MTQQLAGNPLLDCSLAFQMPAFDRITDASYEPAFAEGMRIQLLEIEAITGNDQAPSFANTIEALERSGAVLDRVGRVFFNLVGAHTNDNLEAVQRTIAPQLSAHRDRIMLDAKLFARIAALYEVRAELGLDDESARLLERYFKDFTRSGAALGEGSKNQLKEINTKLARLNTTFSQNVLKASNAAALIVETEAELSGLGAAEISAAKSAARALGKPHCFALPVTNTTQQPLEAQLANRHTRQKLRAAAEGRCLDGEFDNRAIVLEIVALRAQRARLLGYANHAAYVLEDETAQSTDAVNKLLASLAPRAAANAGRESGLLQQRIEADGESFQLQASDWAFYAEKVKRDCYDFDLSSVQPYLELERVLQDGLFYAATQLYGLSFHERHDLPVYHPDVRTFEVHNADGSPLALFLTDFYARPSKRGGAWMNEYVGRSTLTGTRPVVGNHLNVPKPPEGSPTLLTLTELTTLFHEFGHALHGMFSDVQYPRFAGTRVPRDFVEFPSQVNEMWALWPEVFKNYARHWQTNQAMPDALYKKILASSRFNQGFATTEYLAAALLDQAWHQLGPDEIPQDVEAFEAKALRDAGIALAQVPPRYRTCYFSHVFAGGYAAGYYAYIWSEVLDADAGDWFRDRSGLSRKNGDWFRATLLSRGGSQDATAMYRKFRGRDAAPEALLKRRGLEDEAETGEVSQTAA